MDGRLMRRLTILGAAIVFLAVFCMSGSATPVLGRLHAAELLDVGRCHQLEPFGPGHADGEHPGLAPGLRRRLRQRLVSAGQLHRVPDEWLFGHTFRALGPVPDGHPDTSGHCVYEPSRTVSITGGVMNIFLHTAPNGTCMDSSSTHWPPTSGTACTRSGSGPMR